VEVAGVVKAVVEAGQVEVAALAEGGARATASGGRRRRG